MICGLQNAGNTCYLNSILQLIMQCDHFIEFLKGQNDLDLQSSQIFKNIRLFIIEYQANTKISPNTILSIITKNDLFIMGHQHDAHEFLIQFLDMMNEESKKMLKQHVNGFFIFKYYTIFKNRLDPGDMKTLENEEIVLTLPFSPSLLTSIKMFETIEYLHNWQSEKHQRSVFAEKQNIIFHWPDYLFIHINRYDAFFNKIDSEMEIPLEMNDYELQGAVIHQGFLNFGHYICVICMDNKFYLCDDDRIVEILHDTAVAIIKKSYLILFRKKNI